jgi:hypothetical protein
MNLLQIERLFFCSTQTILCYCNKHEIRIDSPLAGSCWPQLFRPDVFVNNYLLRSLSLCLHNTTVQMLSMCLNEARVLFLAATEVFYCSLAGQENESDRDLC